MKKDEIYEKLDGIYSALDGLTGLFLCLINNKDFNLSNNSYCLLGVLFLDQVKELEKIIKALEETK